MRLFNLDFPGELINALFKRRSEVESAAQTWESAPTESLADASHLASLSFDAPSVQDWLKTLETTPEEDLLAEALTEGLAERGKSGPAHAPRAIKPEESAHLKKLVAELGALQAEFTKPWLVAVCLRDTQKTDVGDQKFSASAEDETFCRPLAVRTPVIAQHETRAFAVPVGIKLLQPMGLESHQDSPQPGELAVRTCRTSTELLFLSPLEDVPPQRLTSNCYDAGRGLTAHSCANPRPNTNWQFTAVAPSSLRQKGAARLRSFTQTIELMHCRVARSIVRTCLYVSVSGAAMGRWRVNWPHTPSPSLEGADQLHRILCGHLRAQWLVGPVPVCPREHLRSSPTAAYAFDLRAHWLVPSRCAHASTCGRLQLQPTPSTCELTGWSRPGVPTRAPAVVSNYSLRLRLASSLVGPVPVCPREHLRSSPTTAYAFDLRAHWLVPSRCAHASTCGRLQLQPTPSTCELTGWSRPGVPTRAPAVVSNYSLRLRPASSLVGPVPVCPREHLRSSPTTAYAFDLRAHWLVPSRCAHASTCGRLQLQPTPSTCELTGWSRPGVPTRAPAVVSNYSLRLRPASSLVGPVPVCPREHLRSSPTSAYALRLELRVVPPSRGAHGSTCGRLPLQPTPSTCCLTVGSRPGVPTRALRVSNYNGDLRAHWLVPPRYAHASICGRLQLQRRPASSLVGPVPVCPCEHLRSSPTTAYAFDLRAQWLSRPGVPTRAPAAVSNYSLRLRPAGSLVGPVPVCPREHLRSSPTTGYALDLRAHWLVPSRLCPRGTAADPFSNYIIRLRPASSLLVPPVCPREHLRSSPNYSLAFDLFLPLLFPSRCAHSVEPCGRLLHSNAFDLRAHWLVPSRCAHACTCGRLQPQPTPSTCELTGWSRPGVPTRAPAVVSNYSLRLRPASSLVGPVPVCPREHLRSSPTTAYAFDMRAHWLVPSRCAHASTCGRLQLQPTPSTCELIGWSRPGVPTRAPAVVSNYSLRLRPASSLVGPVPVCPREHLRSSPTSAYTCDLRAHWLVPSRCAHASEHLRSSPTTAYAFDLRAHWLVPSRCAHASTCGRLQLQPTPSTCLLTGWSRPGVPTRAPAVVSNYSQRLRPASSLVGPVPVEHAENLRFVSNYSLYAFDCELTGWYSHACLCPCGNCRVRPTQARLRTCEVLSLVGPVAVCPCEHLRSFQLQLTLLSLLVGPVPVCPREHLRSSPTTAYAFDLRAHWLVSSRCAHASTCGRLPLQRTPASSLVGPVPVCPREHLRSSPTTAYAFDLRAHWLVPSRCAHASTCGRLQLQPTPSTCELTGWSRPGVPTRAPAVVSNYSLRLRPASSLVGPVPVCPREHLRSSPTTATPRPASSLVGPVPVCPREHLRSSPTTAYAFDLRAHWLVPSRCAHASTCGRLQLQTTPSTCELTGWSRPGVPTRAPAVVSNYSLRLRPASSLVGPVPVCPREHLRSSPTSAYACDLRAYCLVPSRCAHASTCGRFQLQRQEAREITLLEREEALRKLQEALEDEQDVLVEQRRSLAGEQARLGRERVETVSHSVPSQMTFDMADDSPADSPAPLDSNFMRPSALTERIEDDRSCRPVRADEVESEGEPDEMWDMDWSALAGGGAKAGASPGRGQKCHDLGARNWRSRIGPGSWCAAAARGETETAGDG
ncbi:unnamed protein product [Polarella glacialis]|uniref:Uncharacterized protein n=1 Tax=Polarella glacialis TaxID=89957 RepID=A0A813KQR7_POLGL|nr:unnamed protein product [Polarella glacialis]